MRDIPVFTTEFGVASLGLKEIPYRQEAYITIQAASGQVSDLVEECVTFCRMAGAERIYCKDCRGMENYPLHTAVLEMRGTAWVDPDKLEHLFPVTEATAARWREIYNEKMAGVDNAATLESRDEERLLQGAYFVHHAGQLLGIGWLEDTKLLAVAGVQPGAGVRVMHTLMSLVEGADMTLEVASTNTRAIRLYETLGFLGVREVSRWYRVG